MKIRRKFQRNKGGWVVLMIWFQPFMQSLMTNETLNTVSKLQTALIVTEVFVSSLPKDAPYQMFEQRCSHFLINCEIRLTLILLVWSIISSIYRLRDWGFEKGWGDNAERVKETMRTLSEVLQAPDPLKMELLFSRLPNMFNIVIFSPHGYFGQADVLGLPDTGGQV